MTSIVCTVFFEEPFWVAVFERRREGQLSAAKTTFGAQPKDAEVLAFILDCFYSLTFSDTIKEETRKKARQNPKRIQREAAKAVLSTGIGTKAQQALKAQYEENKRIRKKESRERKEKETERKFQIRQEKKKAKHKGH